LNDLALNFRQVTDVHRFEKGHPIQAKWGVKAVREFKRGFALSACASAGPDQDPDHTQSLADISPELFEAFDKFMPTFEMPRYGGDEDHSIPWMCDVEVEGPVLVVSHECTTNIGHLMQDYMNWWLAAEVAGLDRDNITVVNIDGLRPATIHNGVGRLLMNPGYPDDPGPFRAILEKVLFKKVVYPLEEGWERKTVCFKEAHLFPFPLKPFLWGKFELVDPCSADATATAKRADMSPAPRVSTLYSKFINDYHSGWRALISEEGGSFASKTTTASSSSSRSRSRSKVRLLWLSRGLTENKEGVLYMSRQLTNEGDVLLLLRKDLQSTHEIVEVNFGNMTLQEQVKLAHDADILAGVHGAGINHVFHMDGSRPGCCGVLEMFPQAEGCTSKQDGEVCSFHKRVGHGNHARYLGFQYDTLVAAPNSFDPLVGTYMDPESVLLKVRIMSARIRGEGDEMEAGSKVRGWVQEVERRTRYSINPGPGTNRTL
jgi:hypothetical protein